MKKIKFIKPGKKKTKVAKKVTKNTVKTKKINIPDNKFVCALKNVFNKIKTLKPAKLQASKGMKFFTMLLLLSMLPLIAAVIIISAVSINVTRNYLENDARESLHIVASNLASYCNDNHISYATADSYNDYLDSLHDRGIEMAIIIDGAPAVASIKNDNNYRVREVPCAKTLADNYDELAAGFFDDSVIVDEKEYFACYVPIEVDGNLLGIAFAGKLAQNVIGDANKSVVIYVIIAIVLIVLFSLATLYISSLFVKEFKKIEEDVVVLADGDLSVKNKKSSRIREISQLSDQINQTKRNLASIINGVKEVSGNLKGAINDVSDLSQNTSGKASSITMAMKELSDATMDMSSNVQNINSQMQEVADCTNEIVESIESLSKASDGMLSSNNKAMEKMQTIIEGSKNTEAAVQGITRQIGETNESIKEVNNVVDLILTISGQTKLLSLNASIEASRAGEAGRGFSVVAEEIRKLSEQSAEGAEAIRTLAETIVEKSAKSVEVTNSVMDQILEERKSIEDTQNQYGMLSNDIKASADEIKAILGKTDNLSRIKDVVLGDVEELSSISEENAAMNEEVNANIDVISGEVESIYTNCEKMTQLSDELDKSVAFFRE